MPDEVRRQLARDDRVVVRPADRDVPLEDFLSLLVPGTNATLPGVALGANATAYLEYTSLAGTFPALAAELAPMPLAAPLHLEHLNLWLSDGRTRGKLHFDPFENLLAMVAGSKELTLYAPHNNTRLYEGHLAEARLALRHREEEDAGGAGATGAVFVRDTLLESTSMVMSPIDLSKPEPAAFPLFADATPVHCRIDPGDGQLMRSGIWEFK
jgi:jumonji domain-containing protein 7